MLIFFQYFCKSNEIKLLSLVLFKHHTVSFLLSNELYFSMSSAYRKVCNSQFERQDKVALDSYRKLELKTELQFKATAILSKGFESGR